MKALAPLADRARATVASFDAFPDSHIPVTAAQAVSVVVDASLPTRALSLIEFAHRAGTLDLETPQQIGTSTRNQVIAAIEEVEDVRDEARRLAAFSPPAEIAEVPRLMAHLASHAAEVVAAAVDVVAAATASDAQSASDALQAALSPEPGADRISELLAASVELGGRDDLDARVSLALGIEGAYTDDYGLVDPVRVFAAAAGQPEPMCALVRGAGRYLSHLLETPPAELPIGAAVLAWGAVELAVLDRPFEPHRLAERVRDLISQAHAASPGALGDALSLYDDDQGRVFASSMRARRRLRALVAGRDDNPVSTVEDVVLIYKGVAEGPYRSCMRFLVAVRAAVEARPAPDVAPLLGDIDGLLDGWHDSLGEALRGSADRGLRNADAHEGFHVDPVTYEVIIGDRRIAPAELEDLVTQLAVSIAAIETAILCYRIDARAEFVAPDWLDKLEHPEAAKMLIGAVAAANDLELFAVRRDHDELILTLEPEADRKLARMLLAAGAPVAPTATVLRAEADGGMITALDRTKLTAWNEAHEQDKDFAFVELICDSQIREGRDPGEAGADALAVGYRSLTSVTLPDVIAAPNAHTPLARLERRLRRMSRFATSNRAVLTPLLQPVVTDLRLARHAVHARMLDPESDEDFSEPIVRLIDWSFARELDDDYLPPDPRG